MLEQHRLWDERGGGGGEGGIRLAVEISNQRISDSKVVAFGEVGAKRGGHRLQRGVGEISLGQDPASHVRERERLDYCRLL